MAGRVRRPRGGWPAPDFLPRAVRPPWLAWVLLLTGAGVLALALADAATQAQRLDEARQRLTRWQKQAQPPIARVVAAAPDAAGVRAAGEVVRARTSVPSWSLVISSSVLRDK